MIGFHPARFPTAGFDTCLRLLGYACGGHKHARNEQTDEANMRPGMIEMKQNSDRRSNFIWYSGPRRIYCDANKICPLVSLDGMRPSYSSKGSSELNINAEMQSRYSTNNGAK